ncbi:hypothetical protein DFQ30_003709 [Apophysomyces sp. BC1015]|nr:hypothetical protein DFQ30_003709 [Apophysomyces sp. BC1015]KAG0178927.1 hypothetical protein DFQ29_002836 [Apophysomyces sp. BC1021]
MSFFVSSVTGGSFLKKKLGQNVFGCSATALDRRSITQGFRLISIATDEFDQGNHTVALDIYLTGLDKMMMAIPNSTDPMTKQAIQLKLNSIQERLGIMKMEVTYEPDAGESKRWSQRVMDTAVTFAVQVKQSPLPGKKKKRQTGSGAWQDAASTFFGGWTTNIILVTEPSELFLAA